MRETSKPAIRIRDVRFKVTVPEIVLRYETVPGVIRIPLRKAA